MRVDGEKLIILGGPLANLRSPKGAIHANANHCAAEVIGVTSNKCQLLWRVNFLGRAVEGRLVVPVVFT